MNRKGKVCSLCLAALLGMLTLTGCDRAAREGFQEGITTGIAAVISAIIEGAAPVEQ